MDKTEILESDRAEGTPEKRRLSALPCTKNDHDWSNHICGSNTALRINFESFQQKFWCSQFVVYHFACFLFQSKNVDNQEINFQINSLIWYGVHQVKESFMKEKKNYICLDWDCSVFLMLTMVFVVIMKFCIR